MAKKQLNKNVVIGVSLVGFAAIVGLSVIMVRQLARRDPKHFVTLAERYQANGEWRQAALFYGKAWERSEDPAYLVSFGQMMLNEGDVRAAAESWQRALIRKPDFVAAYVQLIEMMLEVAEIDGSAANWRQLQESASKFLEIDPANKSPTEQALAHRAFGLALLNLATADGKRETEGIGHLQEAMKLSPGTSDYALDLAGYYVRAGRAAEADRVFQELLAQHPTASGVGSKVRLAYARHLASAAKKQFEEADRQFQESLTYAAGDPKALHEAKLGYAGFLSHQWARAARDESTRPTAEPIFTRAEALLKECIAADSESFDGYVQLATLYSAMGRHAQVVEACEQRLSRDFSRKGLESIRRRLGYFNLQLLASESCVALGLAAVTQGDKDAAEGRFVQAEQYLDRAKGEFPSFPRVLAQSGRIKIARGQERAALNELRAADEAYRNMGVVDWQNKIVLARQHLNLSEPGAALTVLEEVYDQARSVRGNDPAYWLLFGQVLFLNNQLDRALATSERVLQIDPNSSEARKLKAMIYERKGLLTDAAELHQQATGSGIVQALLRFRDLEKSGKLEQGFLVLREALDRDPADVRLVVTAATAMFNAGKKDDASAVVARALAAKPDDAILKKLAIFTRSDLSERQRDDALLEIIQAEPDAFQRALERGTFHIRKSEWAEALKSLNEAEEHLERRDTPLAQTATTTQHRGILVQKMRLAVQLKDESAAAAARDAGAKYNVDGAAGKSLLGLYHVFRDEMEPAARALREAVEAQPTDAESLAYLGHCLLNLGRTDDAKTYFDRAVRINPDEALAHRGLAAIAQAQGDKEGYEQALEICQRLTPNDPWVQAELLARKEQAEPASAIGRREAMLAQKPNDADNLRRLAGLCESAKDLAKADQYHTRLLELNPDDESTVLGAARYFRRTSRPDRALDILTRYADSRTTPDQNAYAQILIAAHYLSQQNAALAETTLLAAADRAPTLSVLQALAEFYSRTADRPDKALVWFDKAAELAKESKSPQLPQILAGRVACLLHRSLNDTATARRYIDELRVQYPDDLRGLYWDSEVYARSGNIEKATATLTDFLKRSPDDAYVLFQRARLYLSLGRTAPALEDLEHIKRAQPAALDLEPRILLAQLHTRAGRTEVAIRELESLVQDAPQSAKAAEELARAYLSAKRSADAERVVTAQINRAAVQTDGRWFYLRGDIAFAAGEVDKALADYQRAAQLGGSSPESISKVLDMYFRTGRFAQGVEYYRNNVAATQPTLALQSRHALLMAKAGRGPEAVNQFRAVMSQAMNDSFAAVRVVLEDFQRAFSTEQALALLESTPSEPNWSRANDRLLSRVFRSAGRTEEATAKLDQTLSTAESDIDRAGLHYEKGEMFQVLGDAAKARAGYEESLKYDNRNWVALNNLAYLLSEKMNEHQLALPYARQAVTLSDTPDTLDTLGWVYVGLGNYSAAIAELSRAVRLDPSQGLLFHHLGEAYRRGGRFLEAGDVLQRGLEVARAAKDQALVDALTASLEKNSRQESGN